MRARHGGVLRCERLHSIEWRGRAKAQSGARWTAQPEVVDLLGDDRRQPFLDHALRGLEIDGAERAHVARQLREDLVLDAATLQRDGVRDLVVEHHHRVARHEASREAPLQLQRQRPLQMELRIAHGVAHLEVVLDRHVGDGVRVRTALLLEAPERAGPVAVPSRACASSSRQSSNAQFMPWPWNGVIACAASPISSSRSSTDQRSQRTVPMMPVGCCRNSSVSAGSSAQTSGK